MRRLAEFFPQSKRLRQDMASILVTPGHDLALPESLQRHRFMTPVINLMLDVQRLT